jgi:myo-inositol-hexaphosphate 3-phosphohydrolase/PKD repeat protein
MALSHARTRRTSGLLAWLLLVVLTTILTSPPSSAVETPVLVSSDRETAAGSHSGDSIDDPAVWVSPTSPASSLVIGNDKQGSLETYDLNGAPVQTVIAGPTWGNVDVRQGLTIGSFTGDLVAGVSSGVRFYKVNPSTRMLSAVNDSTLATGLGEGLCLYQSPTSHKVYGISITIQGHLTEYEIRDSDNDGLLETSTVRSFDIGSEAEGCVADDDTGALYVSQEDVALWRYDAEPTGGSTRESVDVLTGAGGHLANDIEGVTLVDQANGGGYIIASSQNVADPNASYFNVYKRGAGNDFVNTFRVANGTSSDDCDRTDGVTAVTANLGPAFPNGIFVCQDNNNDLPGTSGNQDLKMVKLENVVDLGGTPPPPPPPPDDSPIAFVGKSTMNGSSTAFTTTIPAATRAGDALLLFASHDSTVSLTGPGPGWTQVSSTLVDNSLASTVWRRTAVSGDAGQAVRLTRATATRAAVTLAAYTGVDPSSPIAAVSSVGEPGSTASHTTPLVANSTTGAWRVSYWTDKNQATTRWTAPTTETTRATTTGTGTPRFGALLSDPGVAVTAGTPANTGGLVGTTDATATAAAMWTILLRPSADTLPTNEPPVARFTSNCDELTCTLDGSGSTDAEDSISSYLWDFGDGSTGTEATELHPYGHPGTYDVSLTVTDDVGATDTVEHQVNVGTTAAPISFVNRATSNVNALNFSVQVPSTVQAGDALLLFASQSTSTVLTGPGSDWTQEGRVVDAAHATTVWSRVATAGDAGRVIRLGSGSTYTKVALTLAAYRGTDQTDPVVSTTGAAEPGTAPGHTTPLVANSTTGAWRVSYWSDKNSATTSWTAPAGESNRAATAGSGSGRVGSLLTDSNAGLTAGSPAATGGLVGTADAAASAATSWTLLLRPAG